MGDVDAADGEVDRAVLHAVDARGNRGRDGTSRCSGDAHAADCSGQVGGAAESGGDGTSDLGVLRQAARCRCPNTDMSQRGSWTELGGTQQAVRCGPCCQPRASRFGEPVGASGPRGRRRRRCSRCPLDGCCSRLELGMNEQRAVAADRSPDPHHRRGVAGIFAESKAVRRSCVLTHHQVHQQPYRGCRYSGSQDDDNDYDPSAESLVRKVAFGRHRPTGRPLESSGPVPAPTGPPSPPHVNARAADLWTYHEALTGSKRASGQGENHQVLDRRFNQCVLPRRFRGLGGRVCGWCTATGIGRSGRRSSRSGIDPCRHRRVR